MPKKVLYIINGLGFSNNQPIGGSDKRAVELIRVLKQKHPEDEYSILTTDAGYELFSMNESLQTHYFVTNRPKFWKGFLTRTLVGRSLSYIYACIASFFMPTKFSDYDIFYATSDFFFDVLPAIFFSCVYKKRLVCILHHHIKNPFVRQGSLITNLLLFVNQQLSIFFIRNFSHAILFYDTPEGRKLAAFFKGTKADNHFIYNGINTRLIDQAQSSTKVYAGCFVGGIRPSKGIADFARIWKIVVNVFPEAKLLIIGSGSDEHINKLTQAISEYNLENNMILLGAKKSDPSLFELIKSSKVFVFPSYEEGWGIAICEAMYCELPVVCYNLPAFESFGTELDTIELGNYENMAQKIIFYLTNPHEASAKGKKLRGVAENYTWENIAIAENKILESLLIRNS